MTGAGDAGLQVVRTLIWRRLDTPGTEYFDMRQSTEGWDLSGTVAVALDGVPLLVQYTVVCELDWETRQVEVTTRSGETKRQLQLSVRDTSWSSGGRRLPQLDRASDVDLGVTPSTNTLPIRRLQLKVGEHADLKVAWVRFPDLEVILSNQRYTRLTEDTYRYESGSFQKDIEVDDAGLVVTYPDLFVRETSLG
jgi:uncharacterized protein